MRINRTALIAVALLMAPAAGGAQSIEVAPPAEASGLAAAPPASTRRWGFKTLFRDIGSDFAHLPSRRTWAIAGVGGAAALAVHPLDDDVNGHLQGTSFFGAGSRLGNTFTMMGATFAVYGVALATGHDHVTHVALDVVRAQVVSETLVLGMKLSVRRERPDGSNRLSFPSGHSAVSFATAAVIQTHLGWKWALPAYGLATYVATSRLHDNVHNLSDVVFGAAVGTLAGRTVTRHGASTFALAPMFVPGGAGVLVMRTSGH